MRSPARKHGHGAKVALELGERSTTETPMRKMLLGAVILTLPLAACKKTGDNQYQVQTPTVGLDTHTVTTPSVNVGTKTDTINTPTVGTKKDTIVIDKPVVGTKKTEVKVPTVTVKKP
jgi:hypothetical protein